MIPPKDFSQIQQAELLSREELKPVVEIFLQLMHFENVSKLKGAF